MSARRIAIVVEEPLWRREGRGFLLRLRRAAERALASGTGREGAKMTILLAGDARLASLNARFRGKSDATNVLSFPSDSPDYWGDVAIAHGVATREAASAHKPLHEHALHLAVHGTLHLLGYDHVTARQARVMECLEARILAEFGIPDPYAADRVAAAN